MSSTSATLKKNYCSRQTASLSSIDDEISSRSARGAAVAESHPPPIEMGPPKPAVHSVVKTPAQAYESMVEKGVAMANESWVKIFHQSLYAGVYIGFGGLLSMKESKPRH